MKRESPESLRFAKACGIRAFFLASADHLTLYRDNGFLTSDLEPRFSFRR
ncbi:hypothetical protein BN2476_1150006 [Paraburkholderia piptadeniae]|uniref:Uncharacterized protein n=1 Tax=Paraburkholderia piptadeniae TaxID=1701573 RepID=A0A1N7SUY5_9BURK|nr:hypothetical protein BN2476_1150006 [Paraburkholderia piptadeniae]